MTFCALSSAKGMDIKMTEYTLFLDESYDDNTDLFCIAGCIIKNSDLNIVSNEIESIKQLSGHLLKFLLLSPILHSTELNIDL